MGSAADANWQRVGWLAVSILVAGGALIYWAREIDVLSLGDETAASLGVNAERSGRRVFLIAALLAAATVAAETSQSRRRRRSTNAPSAPSASQPRACSPKYDSPRAAVTTGGIPILRCTADSSAIS